MLSGNGAVYPTLFWEGLLIDGVDSLTKPHSSLLAVLFQSGAEMFLGPEPNENFNKRDFKTYLRVHF